MTPILLSIDPGTKKNAGWAWFCLPPSERYYALTACGVGRWNEIPAGGVGVTVVIERPQIYRASRSKGDPNDMGKLFWIAGEIAGRARAEGSTVGKFEDHPNPRDWKGQVDKDVMIERILRKLPPIEREVLDMVRCGTEARKNIVDAIGIGAWWLRGKGLRAA